VVFLTSETPLGFELPPVSKQLSVEMFKSSGEKTIHNDQTAAQREGLPAPVAVGPQVAALIFRMMRSYFEEGWFKGGKGSLTFRRPIFSADFATAKGIVKEKHLEGDKVRLVCEVWVQNQEGIKAIVGTCSGLVPRN